MRALNQLPVHININSDASKVWIKKLLDQVKERCPVNDNLANLRMLKNESLF